MGARCGAGIAHPSEAPEFYFDSSFSFCPIICHYVSGSATIYISNNVGVRSTMGATSGSGTAYRLLSSYPAFSDVLSLVFCIL
jgi:hypothetical protein